MITRIIAATGIATALMISAASAMTVVNTDTSLHKIMFVPKHGHAHHYSLAAGHHRSIDCKSGGMLTLGKDSQSCDAKTAKVTIKGGKFVM